MSRNPNESINSITLTYKNSKLEKEYKQMISEEYILRFRLALLTGIFFYVIFFFVDPIIFKVAYNYFFAVRVYFVFPVFLITILFTYSEKYKKYPTVFSLLTVMASGIGIVLKAYYGSTDPEIARVYIGLIILFFYLYTMLNIPYLVAGITGTSLATAGMLVAWFINELPWPIFIHTVAMICTANILGMIVSYTIELQSKKEFLLRRELSESVIKDTLTGLYNRHYFEQYSKVEIERFLKHSSNIKQLEKRHGYIKAAQYGILMIDIDHFKAVNDTYGHDSGDKVLEQFAHLMKDNLRSSDALHRFGGEEFLLIAKLTTQEYLIDFIKKLGTLVEEHVFELDEEHVIKCTISMGMVIVPNAELNTIQEIIKISDRALYQSKTQGRNRGHIANKNGARIVYEEVIW